MRLGMGTANVLSPHYIPRRAMPDPLRERYPARFLKLRHDAAAQLDFRCWEEDFICALRHRVESMRGNPPPPRVSATSQCHIVNTRALAAILARPRGAQEHRYRSICPNAGRAVEAFHCEAHSAFSAGEQRARHTHALRQFQSASRLFVSMFTTRKGIIIDRKLS
jgi:hypothetical protein